MHKSSQPAPVSVCMPVYNAERFVAQAVRGVLRQTFRDFEFVIIDDGSTDGSLRILRRFADRDPRIRLISRPHKGLVPTLNELIDESRGEFLARMDPDDIALPGRFARQVEYLRGHPECVLVGSRVWEADEDGDPVAEIFTLEDPGEIDAFHFQAKGPALPHPSVMMRRDAVLAVGKYHDYPIAEDVDLFLRLAERGKLARVPEFLHIYRLHDSNYSASSTSWERSYQTHRRIQAEAFRRRGLPEVFPPPSPIPPPPDPPSYERDSAWGWRALCGGHPRAARKYARRALARRPLSIASWKLMYCALRGH